VRTAVNRDILVANWGKTTIGRVWPVGQVGGEGVPLGGLWPSQNKKWRGGQIKTLFRTAGFDLTGVGGRLYFRWWPVFRTLKNGGTERAPGKSKLQTGAVLGKATAGHPLGWGGGKGGGMGGGVGGGKTFFFQVVGRINGSRWGRGGKSGGSNCRWGCWGGPISWNGGGEGMAKKAPDNPG